MPLFFFKKKNLFFIFLQPLRLKNLQLQIQPRVSFHLNLKICAVFHFFFLGVKNAVCEHAASKKSWFFLD